MDEEKKITRFAWTLANVQASIQDVDRRVLMAAHDGGMTPEVLADCQHKLRDAANALERFPVKL